MRLNTETISAAGVSSTKKSIGFLHGILGRGANWRAVARRWVDVRPSWNAVLFDLRGHGASQSDVLESSITDAARDVIETAASLDALVGHSFGGKVAVLAAPELKATQHVVSVDSNPGARPDQRGSESTVAVITLLRSLRGPWQRRDDFIRDLQAGGQSLGIAQWLGMNLVRANEGFALGLQMDQIEHLMASYFETNAWPAVEQTIAQQRAVHFIRGTRSSVFDAEEQRIATALAQQHPTLVSLDALEAGHWVHVDDFEGLMRCLFERIPE